MAIREVLLLGNPQLYEVSAAVLEEELDDIRNIVTDLHDTLLDFRKRYGAGRAIAAPQIGIMKRLLYMYISEPIVFINPILDMMSEEMIDVWDDCMCFPDLWVKVKRYKSCRISYQDEEGENKEMWLDGDLSELLQHEFDHLDGILAVSRAIDGQSFALKSQREHLSLG
jgi:peptide deformylase